MRENAAASTANGQKWARKNCKCQEKITYVALEKKKKTIKKKKNGFGPGCESAKAAANFVA